MILDAQILDTRGERCPIPLFLTNSRLKQMSPGQILEVVSDCASLLPDIQSIFRKRCNVLDSVYNNNVFRITLQRT